MTSAEIFYNTARVGERYMFDTAIRRSVPLPREALATVNGIDSLFPDRRKSIREDILLVGAYMPLLISMNEAADLGMSSRLERDRTSQSDFYPLLELQNRTLKDLKKSLDTLGLNYPEKKPIAISAINDLLLLSSNRGAFPISSYPEYLEIDSAIFVGSTLSLFFYDQLKEAGYDSELETKSIEDLQKKYDLFILSNNHQSTESHTDFIKKIRALHAMEMCLKIFDDQTGEEIDVRLGLPNFSAWAKQSGNRINLLHNLYGHIAEKGGIPHAIVAATEQLAHVTSIIKAHVKDMNESDDCNLEELFRTVGIGHITTTMRHELRPLIYKIFCKK